MRISRRTLWAATLFAGVAGAWTVPVAEAIIGAPMTPLSVGGVARRSVRRTVVVASAASSQTAAANQQAATANQQAAAANQAAAQSAAAAESAAAAANQAAAAANQAAHPATGAAVASLPAGCSPSGAVYNCSGVYYKPYFQGSTVVYAVVPGP